MSNGDGIERRQTKAGEKRYFVRPYDPTTGEKGRGRTFGTLKEARDYKSDFRKKARRARTVFRCGEFVDRWISEYGAHKRASTIQTHRYALRPFAADFQSRRLNDIDREEAMAFARRHPQAAVVARAMFNDAMNDGLVDVNPFANMRRPLSRGNKDIRVITDDQLRDLVQASRGIHGPIFGEHFASMIEFAAYVGLRQGEQFALRWESLDLEAGDVVIDRSVSRQNALTAPKNGYTRTVALPAPAEEAVRSVVRRVDQPWVFLTKRGGRFSPTAHYATWNPVRAAAGLPDLTWHELRHYAATKLLDMGAPVHVIGQQLGHRDKGERVTARYLHPDEQRGRDAVRELWAKSGSGTSRASKLASTRIGEQR